MEPEIVGFRFHPTPQEFINSHLKRKLQMIHDEDRCVIPDLDIYGYDPRDLRAVYNKKSCRRSTSSDSFFFCPQNHMNTNSGNSKSCNRGRKAGSGYWKETSKKRDIEDEETGQVIGTKRIFSFYYGNQKNARKTEWAMHEYHLNAAIADNTIPDPTAFVLCHIKKKKHYKMAYSRKQQSKSDDSPADLSASTVTHGVTKGIETRETNSELSPLIKEGLQLQDVPEQSPIIISPPNGKLDDASNIIMLSDLATPQDAACYGEATMLSGSPATAIRSPGCSDYMTPEAWWSQGIPAPNDADGGLSLDELLDGN
ncbi:protein NTM1-like 9 isoform X2 [Punica granatum]|uniref:Protein NTM1-like 9 isoform X2 n=1 Tax=Punica granatum TaxID=22663 RepID=A0A218VXZ1_PUNGR|nr:protein NTM1-like 9 isoform X2 [Punica granatum]OWM64742.1 hypothetical protein CDL15_Pgr028459 [Punica granatum]